MKASLRNLTLAAAVVATGSMFAQDAATPTVALKWHQEKTGVTKTEARFGTGVNGKVYYNIKADGKLMSLDGTNDATVATIEGIGTACTADDAGNVVVNTGFPNASSINNWVIVKAGGTTQELKITLPSDFTELANYAAGWGRIDQVGRITGDVMSEDGGIMYLLGNGATQALMVYIKNGEQDTSTFEYSVDDVALPAGANTSSIAQPYYGIDDLLGMGDDACKGFAMRNRSSKAIYYQEDGEWKAVPAPANANTQEGFDWFELGGEMYYIQPTKTSGNYEPEFAITTADGTVLYEEKNYTAMADNSQSFGSFAARKVSDTKVELYQYYASGKGLFGSMYEITIPGGETPEEPVELPEFYLRGDMNDWNAEATYRLLYTGDIENPTVNDNGEYEFKLVLDALFGDFKIAQADWNNTNYGREENNVLNNNEAANAWKGSNNFQLNGKTYTDVTINFYYNPDETQASRIMISGTEYEEPFELPEIYLTGDMVDWGNEGYLRLMYTGDMENPTPNDNGEYEFKLYLDALFGDFKFMGKTWGDFNYGAKGGDNTITESGVTLEAWNGSSENFKLGEDQYTEVTIMFYYNPDASKPSYVKFEGTKYVEAVPTADKGHFAHKLSATAGENNNYTIKFHSTGDAAKAVLVLTNKADETDVIETELGTVAKGENTFTYNAGDLKEGNSYNWAVRVHNHAITEVKVSEATKVASARGALTVFTDPRYPESYGKMVITKTRNGGINIYDADGNLEAEDLHVNCAALGGSAANNSCAMDGKQRGNEILMASWGDAAYGVTAFDITTPDVAPYSVFEGVKEASGKVMNGDAAVGSGTPCVAFWENGEDSKLFTFDEDIFGNKLAQHNIGLNKTVGTAAIELGFGNALANTNVSMWPAPNGLWLTQVRANGMETGVVGLGYYDFDEADITWRASDMAEIDEHWLPNAASGVAVNPAGDLLAVATYTGIEVMLLSWEDNKPVLEKYMTVTTANQAAKRTQLCFDPADNLHVMNETNGYYTVSLPTEEPLATTAAHPESVIANQSAVANINVELNQADAVYYNTNGMRVDAANMTPGVYVKVIGKTATKVIVK